MAFFSQSPKFDANNRHHRSQDEVIHKENSARKNPQLLKAMNIPLISKKMNSIEKYISEFNNKQVETSRVLKDTLSDRSKILNSSTQREVNNDYRSIEAEQLTCREELDKLENRCCVKYDPIRQQKSEERIEILSRLQKDYSLLKSKIHPHKKYQSNEMLLDKPRRFFQSKKLEHISDEEVKKEIKNVIVKQNGKKYFADLYLMKKGRQNIINSLQNVGKLSLGTYNDGLSLQNLSSKLTLTYEQKMKANEQKFVRGKIIQDREVKRTKMMKGRNLHWNVYYDMLALSAAEKKKLKGVCKFSSTYGIV